MAINKKYAIDKNRVVYKVVDKETIILDLNNGNYYSLNDSAAFIWESLSTGKNLDEIIGSMKKSFPAEENALKENTIHLLKKLEKINLIKKA